MGDPDLRDQTEMPVGGVDTGPGGSSGSHQGLLLAAGAGLTALGAGSVVLVRRRSR